MRHLLFLLLFICLSLSCKQTKTSEGKPVEISKEQQDKKDAPTASIVWSDFTAAGNEPAWNIEIKANESELVYQLELENGGILKIGSAKIISSNEKAIAVQLESNEELIQIQILNKECKTDSDEIKEKTTFFTYNKKRYNGCGNFEKQPS